MAITKVIANVAGVPYTLSLQNGVWKATIPSSQLSVGKVGVNLSATNSVGMETKDYREFTVVPEKTPPTVVITSPQPDSWHENNLQPLAFSITDNVMGSGVNLQATKLSVDGVAIPMSTVVGEPISNGYKCTHNPSKPWSDGQHTLSIQAQDLAGNLSAVYSVTFRVDANAPTLELTSPPDGYFTNNSNIRVSGSSSDLGAGLKEVRVNGSVVSTDQDGNFSTTVKLSDGLNTITVVATDLLDKSATISRQVILDQTPPAISTIYMAPYFSDWLRFKVVVVLGNPGAYSSPETVVGSCNGEPLAFSEDSPNVWSAVVDRSEKYAVEVTAQDQAGNSVTRQIEFSNGYDLRWDWTYQDFLNFWDLNRIETATKRLRKWLESRGYRAGSLAIKDDWYRDDHTELDGMNRIRSNVDALQFFPIPGWIPIEYRDTVDSLQVNAIEFDLWLVDNWLVKAELSDFIHSDMIHSGMWP